MASPTRKLYHISQEDWDALRRCTAIGTLRDPQKLRAHWAVMGQRMGFDPATVVPTQNYFDFTALPPGHGQYWCYPYPLKSAHVPTYDDPTPNKWQKSLSVLPHGVRAIVYGVADLLKGATKFAKPSIKRNHAQIAWFNERIGTIKSRVGRARELLSAML